MIYKSLSARRAWIEIAMTSQISVSTVVSLSARRAWIEISLSGSFVSSMQKSLSARRAWIEIHKCNYIQHVFNRRSPQGERG